VAVATLNDRALSPCEQLIGRDYLSFSAVKTYQGCPLRFKFRYVEGLPEDIVSSALVFGSAVHRAIERHFCELLAGNPPPDGQALLEEYRQEWQERDLSGIRFGKDEDSESLEHLAEKMLAAFQASEAAVPQGRILAVEEELRGAVIPGCPDLLGRVDLIIETDDALQVCDWKTARTRWSQEQAEDASEQLLLYAELAKDFAPGKPVRLEFVILTKTKETAIDRHVLSVDPVKVARTKHVVENVWRSIEAGLYYPSPSAINCPGCAYRDYCRSWTG
jgi:putative RecB family exonuclease